MLQENDSTRRTIKKMNEELTGNHTDLENFHNRVVERVDGILLNAKEYRLHHLVEQQLQDIKSMSISITRFYKSE